MEFQTSRMLLIPWPKPLHFAIVDELDYVLIDEGRNPLLIRGEASKDAARNTVAAKVAELLMRGLQCKVSFLTMLSRSKALMSTHSLYVGMLNGCLPFACFVYGKAQSQVGPSDGQICNPSGGQSRAGHDVRQGPRLSGTQYQARPNAGWEPSM
uniref:chloroplast protein-transporting ATPase n=1 Tax=Lactuca sativa TaxID=4236 RepID=A0A9R1UCZ9_LACSA|nr:hypothetical protein LSAT_V11C900481940 [Lactuca sativa]